MKGRKPYPRRLPTASKLYGNSHPERHARELTVLEEPREKENSSIITKDVSLENIHICPSYDAGPSEHYQEMENRPWFDYLLIQHRRSLFECDNCSVVFPATAPHLVLDKMECPNCGKMSVGFKKNLNNDVFGSEPEDDDDE